MDSSTILDTQLFGGLKLPLYPHDEPDMFFSWSRVDFRRKYDPTNTHVNVEPDGLTTDGQWSATDTDVDIESDGSSPSTTRFRQSFPSDPRDEAEWNWSPASTTSSDKWVEPDIYTDVESGWFNSWPERQSEGGMTDMELRAVMKYVCFVALPLSSTLMSRQLEYIREYWMSNPKPRPPPVPESSDTTWLWTNARMHRGRLRYPLAVVYYRRCIEVMDVHTARGSTAEHHLEMIEAMRGQDMVRDTLQATTNVVRRYYPGLGKQIPDQAYFIEHHKDDHTLAALLFMWAYLNIRAWIRIQPRLRSCERVFDCIRDHAGTHETLCTSASYVSQISCVMCATHGRS